MSNLPDIAEAAVDFITTGNARRGAHGGGASHQFESRAGASREIMHRVDKLPAAVRPYAMMTKTGYMEFDPISPRGHLPGIFARCVGPLIGRTVYLQDKNENQIQVSVEHENGEVYFTNGWSRLRDFYDIGSGAWVTLLFISPFIFHIRLRHITGVEVTYPLKNPPHRLLLSNPFGEVPSSGPVPFFVLPATFAHRLEKTLTDSDVQTGALTLFWGGFCESAFAKEETQLTLVDWLGNIWDRCYLQFDNNSEMTCKISRQWRDICGVHHLDKGVIIKFGVTDSSNNKTVYFKLSPFIGVKTTLIAPLANGTNRAFYQSQNFFML